MTAVVELKSEARSATGKGGARSSRRQGFVPGIIYGDKKEGLPIQIRQNLFLKAYHGGGFFTKLFDIDIDGKKTRVLARDVQTHPVNDLPEHVDFMRVSDKTKLRLDIPVHVTGEDKCPGIKGGGVLTILAHEIEVSCMASNIPSSIDIDISTLEISDSIKLEDIKFPTGVVPTHSEEDFTVLMISTPTVDEEPQHSEIAAAEAAAAEGEKKEGAEASKDDKSDKKADSKEDKK